MVDALLLYFTRYVLISYYTSEQDVIELATHCMIFMAVFHLPDGLQGTLQGTIRGLGLQERAAYLAVGIFYLIGIPTAWLLTFNCRLGLTGLWLGIGTAAISQAIAYWFIITISDWNKVVVEA